MEMTCFIFLVCPMIPLQYASKADFMVGTLNPAYHTWLKRDKMLLLWLQTTISIEILNRILGSIHAYELWDRLHAYFKKTSSREARQFHAELRSTQLNDRTV